MMCSCPRNCGCAAWVTEGLFCFLKDCIKELVLVFLFVNVRPTSQGSDPVNPFHHEDRFWPYSDLSSVCRNLCGLKVIVGPHSQCDTGDLWHRLILQLVWMFWTAPGSLFFSIASNWLPRLPRPSFLSDGRSYTVYFIGHIRCTRCTVKLNWNSASDSRSAEEQWAAAVHFFGRGTLTGRYTGWRELTVLTITPLCSSSCYCSY